jgi:hypothetical protein
MYQAFNCDIKEINLKDMNPIYTKDVLLYNMMICTDLGNLNVDSMRLIYLFVKTKDHVIFKFMNMNKYCGKNYKKFSDTYTQFDLNPTSKKLHISYYGYFICGDESSKEVFEVLEIDISNCFILDEFLYLLYTKYKNLDAI